MKMEVKPPESAPKEDGDAGIENSAKLQDLIDAALYIHEVVKSICSAITSVKDLMNLRLVNKTFHYEATVRMRTVPAQIEFTTDKTMATFLAFIKTNGGLNTVSPFTAFKLKLNEPAEVLEEFATVIGPAAGHYTLRARSTSSSMHQLAVLLSRSPFIRSLHLSLDQFLSAEDLALLPYFSELQVIEIDSSNFYGDNLLGTFSLLSALVSQPSPLKHVRVPPLEGGVIPGTERRFMIVPNIQVFRAIAQNHQRLPTVSMNAMSSRRNLFTIEPPTLSLLEELMKMNFKFRDLSMETDCDREDRVTGEKLLHTLSVWLNSQSRSLVSLNLQHHISNGTLVLPPFPRLEELWLHINGFGTELENGDDHNIQPFTRDQFPVLRKFDLTCCENHFKIFARTRLPSVEKLSLILYYGAFTESWKSILPNLRILRLECDSKELAIILTQFTEITELQVTLKLGDDGEPDLNYWEIWTGGAPRPQDIKALLNTDIETGSSQVEESVQENVGSFQVPSLRNMKVLKKLTCRYNEPDDLPKLHLLDPIMYMTLTKQLVPLQELNIVIIIHNVAEETRVEYENILAKFHENVKISNNFRQFTSSDEEDEEETDYEDWNNGENMDDEEDEIFDDVPEHHDD